jgi:hypothetical protein
VSVRASLLRKIDALEAKAASTAFEPEARACRDKAAELRAKLPAAPQPPRDQTVPAFYVDAFRDAIRRYEEATGSGDEAERMARAYPDLWRTFVDRLSPSEREQFNQIMRPVLRARGAG